MRLGFPSHDRVSFDPLKPIILRGSPEDDAKSVFSGNVVLSLSKATKISTVSVTLRSESNTYWPEGVGVRGTQQTAEKVLSEETLYVFKKKPGTTFVAGVHRFPFAFLVPNTVVDTIEDVYGRVRHTVEARVTRPGFALLNSMTASETVLVLRTYMSNSILTNNSLQDLSRTLEKHTVPADVQVVVEQAAFSPGEIFHIRTIIQPQRKQVRLEQMEVTVLESRRYCEPELGATRTDSSVFPLHLISGANLLDDIQGAVDSTREIADIFEKHQPGIDLLDTFAHRMTFATPKCHSNIHHTTHFKNISFKHHICVRLTLSYFDDDSVDIPHNNDNLDANHITNTAAFNSSSNGIAEQIATSQQWHNKFFKFGKSRDKADLDVLRKRETVQFEVPVLVFDCRLKEDFSVLPSYFELNMPLRDNAASEKGAGSTGDQTLHTPGREDPVSEPNTYLCDCYRQFARQMQYASQPPFLVTITSMPPSPETELERIPSKPPPEYDILS